MKKKFMSLRKTIMLSTVLPYFVLGFAIIMYIYLDLYKSKLEEASEIYYLETEQKSNYLSNYIKKLSQDVGRLNTANIVAIHRDQKFEIQKSSDIEQKNLMEYLHLYQRHSSEIKYFIFKHQDRTFVLWSELNNIYGTQIDILNILSLKERNKIWQNVYIISDNGQLIESNSNRLRVENIKNRELVKSFLNEKLSNGIKNIVFDGAKYLGFYSTVFDTNIVIFFETPLKQILKPTMNSIKNFILLYILILLGVTSMMYFITNYLLMPINPLLKRLNAIEMNMPMQKPLTLTVGEFGVLAQAIDRLWQKILLSKKNDLTGSKKIINFMPTQMLNALSGIDYAFVQNGTNAWRNAWYNFYYNPQEDSIYFAMAYFPCDYDVEEYIKSTLETSLQALQYVTHPINFLNRVVAGINERFTQNNMKPQNFNFTLVSYDRRQNFCSILYCNQLLIYERHLQNEISKKQKSIKKEGYLNIINIENVRSLELFFVILLGKNNRISNLSPNYNISVLDNTYLLQKQLDDGLSTEDYIFGSFRLV